MMESASLVLRANTNTAVLTAMGLIPALSAHFESLCLSRNFKNKKKENNKQFYHLPSL